MMYKYFCIASIAATIFCGGCQPDQTEKVTNHAVRDVDDADSKTANSVRTRPTSQIVIPEHDKKNPQLPDIGQIKTTTEPMPSVEYKQVLQLDETLGEHWYPESRLTAELVVEIALLESEIVFRKQQLEMIERYENNHLVTRRDPGSFLIFLEVSGRLKTETINRLAECQSRLKKTREVHRRLARAD